LRYFSRYWIRGVILVLTFSSIITIHFCGVDISGFKNKLIAIIPSVSLLFAISTALLLALMSNAVFGLKKQLSEHIHKVRERAWDCYEQYSESDDKAIQVLLKKNLELLLCLPAQSFNDPEEYKPWEDGIEDLLNSMKMTSENFRLLHKYLLPIEEDINHIGLLFVRRVIVNGHLKLLLETFSLIIVSMATTILGGLLPSTMYVDLIIACIAAGVLVLAPIQMLVVLTYFHLEAREERLNTEE